MVQAESPSTTQPPVRTLGLTGVTIKAMTLSAPGAFLWVMFQTQIAQTGGLSDLWPGLLLALGVAVLTALSFGELSRRYPEAGGRGSYYFAEKIFLDQQRLAHPRWVRLAKFVTGWAAHLFYWVYPGVLLAFGTRLTAHILQQVGMEVLTPGLAMLGVGLALLAGLLAGRGITGSTDLAAGLNLTQVLTLTVFAGLVLLFRWQNPLGLTDWVYESPMKVILPHSASGTLFQAGLAILILAGFESAGSLATEAANPRRDVPRGVVLAVLLQGIGVYLFGYFAINAALNSRWVAEASRLQANADIPLSLLASQVGDSLLGGNGLALALVMALTSAPALLGAMLAALNMGVRLSFAMAQDQDMPEWLGALHPDFATPYVAVWILVAVATALGVAGAVYPVFLTGLILAANIGVFSLYALIGLLAAVSLPRTQPVGRKLVPWATAVGNLGLLTALVGIGLTSPAPTRIATVLALGIAGIWVLISSGYMLLQARRR